MRPRNINKYLPACLGLLLMMSLARMSDNTEYWIIDIFSHFPMQYALLASVILFFSLWKKQLKSALFAGLILALNLTVLAGPVKTVQASAPADGVFSLYSANLHISNDDVSRLTGELKRMDPEMVLLLEVTPQHNSKLGELKQRYPYLVERMFHGEEDIGFVFLSKFPVLSSEITRLSDVCNFVLEAKVEIDRKPVMFYGFHARRPDFKGFGERREQFLGLAADLRAQDLPVIVAGDYNSTPFAPIFRKLLSVSGLKDSAAEFGWQPSWPTYVPFLWIPIDHMLVSPEVLVHKRATGSYIGSDHYPVFAELSIQY